MFKFAIMKATEFGHWEACSQHDSWGKHRKFRTEIFTEIVSLMVSYIQYMIVM